MERPSPRVFAYLSICVLTLVIAVVCYMRLKPAHAPAPSGNTPPPASLDHVTPTPSPAKGPVLENVKEVAIALPQATGEVQAGSRTALQLIATTQLPDGTTTSTDVTRYTSWSLPEGSISRATVDNQGWLTVDLSATGTLDVHASWNNGEEPFSRMLTLTITPRP